ncbi:Uncharacterized protein HZ326_10864 [Fusarium oxysporum f. sp. albedinis]|nr:Uncharacterized protein HZ326_10864 [Fusarium oxysporum f. sp. albedinis]
MVKAESHGWLGRSDWSSQATWNNGKMRKGCPEPGCPGNNGSHKNLVFVTRINFTDFKLEAREAEESHGSLNVGVGVSIELENGSNEACDSLGPFPRRTPSHY